MFNGGRHDTKLRAIIQNKKKNDSFKGNDKNDILWKLYTVILFIIEEKIRIAMPIFWQ